MSFIPTQYNDPVFVYSLRRLVQNYNDPIVRVIRESDHVEVDVYADSNEEVSYDSIIARTNDTEATVLGEFLNIDGYTDADGLGEVYKGRLSKIYDQSAGSFDVGVNIYNVSFLFVETNLPAYGGSTAIHKVNGVPAFFATATQPMFKLAQARGREVSYHFMTEGVGATQYFGFIEGATNTYRIWGVHDVQLEETIAALLPSTQWGVNDVYFDSEQASLSSGVYSADTFNNFDSVITTVEAQLLDTSTTQAAFPDNEVTFSVMSNNWYCDIVAFDGYDPIRRITIEQLYAQSASNTTAFAKTSSLLINNENPNQSGFLAQFPNAAAAYSVRSLTGNTGTDGPKVVRVRRDSDNVEVDVYTDETGFITLDSPISAIHAITGGIDGGTGAELETLAETLGEFVFATDYGNPDNLASPDTAKVVVWYDQSDTNYSLSNLPEGIEERGAPIRIRVVGGTYDNHEFDVYFDDNETISLSSYVADTYEITDSNDQVTANLSNGTLEDLENAGMTEATVVAWYDQSGNGNDATQATTSAQPKVYDSSTGYLAHLFFDGNNDALQSPNNAIGAVSELSLACVSAMTSETNNRVMVSASDGGYTGVDSWFSLQRNASGLFAFRGSNIGDVFAGSADTNEHLFFGSLNASQISLAVDSSNNTASSTGGPWDFSAEIDFSVIDNDGGLLLLTQIETKEVIIWPSDQSANRTGIETNINDYYDIYGTGNTGDNEPLLDTYTDAAAAYSLRKLRTAYSGPVNLSNRKDAKQQVSTNQPTLVSSGELVKENGKAAVEFGGGDDLLSGESLSVKTAFTVTKSDIAGRSTIIGGPHNVYLRTSGYVIKLSSDPAFELSGQTIGSHNLIYGLYDGADSKLANRGGAPATGDAGAGFYPDFKIGSKGGGNYHHGTMQEIVIYDSDQSANRTDIETNINAAFQIYSAAFPSALDTVPEAKAAYSVRRLTKEYAGPIITVDNGNTTKDFYADFWGNLDKTALTDFANGGTLSITKWWDQSGREEHLVATGGSKPTIDPATLNITVDSTNVFNSSAVINDINALTAGNNNLVAVFGGAINDTINLNATAYTDLKEIIHYQ